jgi:1-acyl-sn-glycerol-3-phosphate acyltransferase
MFRLRGAREAAGQGGGAATGGAAAAARGGGADADTADAATTTTTTPPAAATLATPPPPTSAAYSDDDSNDDDCNTDSTDAARLLALADEPRFAPFVRQDAYGQGGAGPWTWGERARLAVCCVVLVPLRAIVALLCVACYYGFCRVAASLPAPRTRRGRAMRRRNLARAGRFWSRACLLALGFWRVEWLSVAPDGSRAHAGPPWRIDRLPTADAAAAGRRRSGKAAGAEGGSGGGGGGVARPLPQPTRQMMAQVPPPAVVANHVGWVDILVVMSRYFPSFVAREGTQGLPLIGLISRQMQCLYVDREKKQQQGQGQGQQQGAAAAAANGGAGGGPPGGGSSVSAAVRARMRRAAARTGLLQAMLVAESSGGGGADGIADAATTTNDGEIADADADADADDSGAERPMLLFPEGTTSNGRYLLPFRTGAFLAGVPVRPVVLSYSSCGGGLAGGLRPGGVLASAAAAARQQRWQRRGNSGGGGGGSAGGGGGSSSGGGGGGGGGALVPKLPLLAPLGERYCDTGGGSGGGRLSLAWESISAVVHVLLVLASPWQSAVGLELPLCVPTAEERRDPRRFAARVRGELLRATALLPSDSGLEEKREYQQRLREVLGARDKPPGQRRRKRL